jgi:hypothetical protein
VRDGFHAETARKSGQEKVPRHRSPPLNSSSLNLPAHSGNDLQNDLQTRKQKTAQMGSITDAILRQNLKIS